MFIHQLNSFAVRDITHICTLYNFLMQTLALILPMCIRSHFANATHFHLLLAGCTALLRHNPSLLPPATRLLYTPSPSSARCRTSAYLSHRHPATTQFLHACPLSSAYTASSHLSIPHPLATQLRQACPTLIRSCTATPGAPHLASFTVLSDLPLVLPATASFVRQLHGFLTNLFHV